MPSFAIPEDILASEPVERRLAAILAADIVKTTGDGMLLEFASVLDALRIAHAHLERSSALYRPEDHEPILDGLPEAGWRG
jgi:class 3 adenylate cyclase